MSFFEPELLPRFMPFPEEDSGAVAILFSGKEILLVADNGQMRYPFIAELQFSLFSQKEYLHLGILNGRACFGGEWKAFPDVLPERLIRSETRFVLANFPQGSCSAACRARELLFWRKHHRFCGACAAPLTESPKDLAMVCPVCSARFYPQLAPAVIVAVTRGDEILLAHNRNFQSSIYGLIAGFVEAGENAEQTVERELLEETGIRVKNIRYLSSQSWPFPNSLMLGFTAEYASGEARPDGTELETLGWFHADRLPEIPPSGSIAHRMINAFRIDHLRGDAE